MLEPLPEPYGVCKASMRGDEPSDSEPDISKTSLSCPPACGRVRAFVCLASSNALVRAPPAPITTRGFRTADSRHLAPSFRACPASAKRNATSDSGGKASADEERRGEPGRAAARGRAPDGRGWMGRVFPAAGRLGEGSRPSRQLTGVGSLAPLRHFCTISCTVSIPRFLFFLFCSSRNQQYSYQEKDR